MGFWNAAGGAAKFMLDNMMSQAADANERRARDRRYSEEERGEFRKQAAQYREAGKMVRNAENITDLLNVENVDSDMEDY